MSRQPLLDVTGRQYGEVVKGVAVRPCWGEDIRLTTYECPEDTADEYDLHWRAFATDIRKGAYDGRIIRSATARWDEAYDRYVLDVTYTEIRDGGYDWGNAGPR